MIDWYADRSDHCRSNANCQIINKPIYRSVSTWLYNTHMYDLHCPILTVKRYKPARFATWQSSRPFWNVEGTTTSSCQEICYSYLKLHISFMIMWTTSEFQLVLSVLLFFACVFYYQPCLQYILHMQFVLHSINHMMTWNIILHRRYPGY